MAAMTVISSAVCQTSVQPSRGIALASSSSVVGGRVKSNSQSLALKRSFLSQDRHIQSLFSSQALGVKSERSCHSITRSSRAELASNADTGTVIDISDADEMRRHIAESGDRLVVVDVSTKTCGPCKLIFPKFVKLSKEYEGPLFLRILGDFDSGTKALMREWGVRGVPNFRFFRNGKLVHTHTGAKEDELRGHFLYHYHQSPSVTAK